MKALPRTRPAPIAAAPGKGTARRGGGRCPVAPRLRLSAPAAAFASAPV